VREKEKEKREEKVGSYCSNSTLFSITSISRKEGGGEKDLSGSCLSGPRYKPQQRFGGRWPWEIILV